MMSYTKTKILFVDYINVAHPFKIGLRINEDLIGKAFLPLQSRHPCYRRSERNRVSTYRSAYKT